MLVCDTLPPLDVIGITLKVVRACKVTVTIKEACIMGWVFSMDVKLKEIVNQNTQN